MGCNECSVVKHGWQRESPNQMIFKIYICIYIIIITLKTIYSVYCIYIYYLCVFMYVWENNWTKRHCPATKLCLITGGHLCFLHVSSIVCMVGNSSNGYSRSPEGHLCITHFKYQWRRKEMTCLEQPIRMGFSGARDNM